VPVGTSLAGGVNNQIQYNNSGVLNGFTMSGDATIVPTTGAITVSKTGGVAFAASATTNTTLTGNINYTQGGTGSVSRTVTSKLQEWISPADFGAVGNGTTDDSAAIQNAINAAASTNGVVRFATGVTYAINSQIVVNGPITIFGNGATLKRTFDSNYIYALKTTGTNVTIYNLTIDGNRSALTASEFKGCFEIQSTNTSLYSCYGNNAMGDGIQIDSNASYVHLVSCGFDNCYRNGGSVTQANRVTFTDCAFTNTNGTSPQAGLDIEPDTAAYDVYEVNCIGCRFENNTTSGVSIGMAATPTGIQRDVNLTNCSMLGNFIGLNILTGYNVHVVGCDLGSSTTSGALGIQVNSKVIGLQVIGGKISGAGARGVSLIGATATSVLFSGVTIIDNAVTNSGVPGIIATGGTFTDLAIIGCRIGNTGTGNQGYGVQTDSTVTKLRLIGNNLSGNLYGGTTLADQASSRLVQSNQGMTYPQGADFTLAAAASTTINNNLITGLSIIVLTPVNASAGVLQGSAKAIYVSGRTAGTSFTVSTANGVAAAGTEIFSYYILSQGN
jgi:hypothetical protein